MKKYALIIPVNLRKINWYCAFLHSIDKDKLQELDFDLVICTSNLQEQDTIMSCLQIIAKEYVPYIKVLDIDTYIRETSQLPESLRYLLQTGGVINVKKFCALHWAMLKYEYVAVADCDILFRDKESPSKLFARCIENYEKNIYITSTPPSNDLFKSIMMSCSIFYPERDQATLKNLTNEWTTYPWFFELPVYKKEDLAQFFSFVENKSPIPFWYCLSWLSFEHLVFIYFRLLYCNCQFKDVTHITNGRRVLEHTNFDFLTKIENDTGYLPIWMSSRMFIESIQHGHEAAKQEILMFSHADRI
ncbi:MAG: hypothetical protein IKI11_00615 [Neisseriaceae bacterium]|nr:hypothetical protein [Neisseriaceae bacterium]